MLSYPSGMTVSKRALDHAHRPARHEQNPLRTRVAPTRARPPNLADQVRRRADPGGPLGGPTRSTGAFLADLYASRRVGLP